MSAPELPNVSYELITAVLAAVQETLDELRAGEHATGSRDFGRGVAHASALIAGAVASAIEIHLDPLTVPDA